MAARKFESSGRSDKRPFPKKDREKRGGGFEDRKTFKSKFSRRGTGESSRGKSESKFPDKRRPSSTSTKKITDDRGDRPGFSKRKDFEKHGAGEGFKKRRYAAERAFSPGKKYFKRKEDGGDGGRKEEKRPFNKAGNGFFKDKPKSFGGSKYGKPKKFSSHKRRDVMTEKPKDGLIRLNKFISNSGVCSRREADELIKMGLISVNGQVITEMGYKVKPTDDVRHEAKKLHAEKPVYILMNKPKGYITTTDDPQERKTVMGLIGNAVKERIYPVGRLDRNTTGLLLFTNDGDLADKLTHPSYKAKKIYRVELNKALTKADFDKILEGVRLEEGKAVVDDLAYVDGDPKIIGIEIHIGWNRVVRRIFELQGYEVIKLDRVVYAGLDKKNLGRGEWRFLKEQEVVKLKHLKS